MSASKMTGREAIEWFLDEHGYFTADEVSKATGVPRQHVAAASFKMRRSGEITLLERRWRVGIYAWADEGEDRKISRDGVNTIFSECRSSAAMRRVLSIYGVMA
ncbi:type IV toxin-antitoxin system AbiEi family antitoxin domain-containing protein [Kluyvera intermedia]|uniref:Protein ren n=1 Tax=Kluyvera intermedia TaxID=61648 RepID=A0ABX6DVY0_KLUIN|nr:type IV toxin-antitoxin system AbiEi family antitoxin domain-containing protein [Kluyvera intermedia]QGH31070.1 protein ren [Kluyvera intermedia]QGH40052.1 protein ren [Kluyvera intermedia]